MPGSRIARRAANRCERIGSPMLRAHSFILAALLAAAVCLGAAGCGGSDDAQNRQAVSAIQRNVAPSITRLDSARQKARSGGEKAEQELQAAASEAVDTLSNAIQQLDSVEAENGATPETRAYRRNLERQRDLARSLVPGGGPRRQGPRKPAGKSPSATKPAPDGGKQDDTGPGEPEQKSRSFHTSGSDITCEVTTKSAICAIDSLSLSYVIIGDRQARLESGLRLEYKTGSQVGWGTKIVVGDFSCLLPTGGSERSGVTCRNRSTGAEFNANNQPID